MHILMFNVGQSTTQYSACTCTVWYFNLQWVQYTCITVQDYIVWPQYSACTCTVWYFNLQWVQYTCSARLYCVASVQANCSTRLHCVVTAGAQKWPSIHPSLINQNQSLITMMIMIGVHREYRIGIW